MLIDSNKKEVICKNINLTCKILLICILIFTILGMAFFEKNDFSNTLITVEALVVSILAILTLFTEKSIPKLGMSMCILVYTICTQFGAGIVYYLVNKYYSADFLKHSDFLESEFYGRSMMIAIIAIICYVIAINVTSYIKIKKDKIESKEKESDDNKLDIEKKLILYSGYAFIFIILIFFVIMLVTGKISVSMSYNDYINTFSRILGRGYAILMLCYAIGICFVMAVGNKKQMLIGIILFGITALILFVTGNRGEVLYPILACIGVYSYRKFKINWKMIIVLCLILFMAIPYIRQYRDAKATIGEDNKKSIIYNITEPFVEMGMQLRLSVYVMEELDNGTIDYLNGFSYGYAAIKPLGYILPINDFIDIPEDYEFEKRFPTMAFSQVAESYANFGVFGVILFYTIFGLIMGFIENRELSSMQLAFSACFTEIMINATRNYFSMVPTMILIVLIILGAIHLICKYLKKIKYT